MVWCAACSDSDSRPAISGDRQNKAGLRSQGVDGVDGWIAIAIQNAALTGITSWITELRWQYALECIGENTDFIGSTGVTTTGPIKEVCWAKGNSLHDTKRVGCVCRIGAEIR